MRVGSITKGSVASFRLPLPVGERAGVRGAGFDPAQQLRQNAFQLLQNFQITETQHLQPLTLALSPEGRGDWTELGCRSGVG
ncbi:hypothetical protein BV581_09985 [Stutzerimonas stutzeri]|nr:hypothetical protein BV581_09985 [Stutzerimonas stutzeri]GLZ24589.1 hypothetical protein Pstu01_12590 [Stutzerimonas stutzeri]